MERAQHTAARPARPRRWLRRLVKICLLTLAVLLGLPVVVCLALVGTLPDARLLQITLAQVRAATGLDVRARALELHLLDGLVLDGVSLRPPAGFRDPPLEVERLTLGYAPGDLLDGRLVVRSLRLERAHLRLQHDGARTNLAALLASLPPAAPRAPGPPEPDEPSGFELVLERGEVRELTVELSLPGLRAELAGLSLDLAGRLGAQAAPEAEVRLRLPQPAADNLRLGEELSGLVGLEVEGKLAGPVASAAVQAEVRSGALRGRRLRVEARAELDLVAGQGRLEALGLALDGVPVLEAQGGLDGLYGQRAFQLRVSRAVLLEPGQPGLAGLVPGLPAFAGRAWLEELALDGALDGGLPGLKGSLHLSGLGASVAGLQLQDLGGKLRIGFSPADGRLALAGSLRAGGLWVAGLRLERLRGELDVAGGLTSGPDGLVVAQPRLTWDGSAEALRTAWLQADGLDLEVRLAGPRVERGPAGWAAPGAELELEGGCRSVGLAAGPEGARLDALELHGSASGGGLRLAPGAAPRAARLEARLALSAAHLRQGPLQLDALGLELTARAGELLAGGRAPGSLEAALRCGPLQRGPLGLARAEAGLRLELASLAPRELPVRLSTRVEELRWERPGGAPPFRAPAPVTLEADTRLGLPGLDVRVERSSLAVAGLIGLELSGELSPGAGTLRGELSTAPHRLEALVASLPEDVRAAVPRIAGEVRLSGWVRGRLPGREFDLFHPPFEAELTVAHQGLELELPAVGLRVAGVSGPVRVHLGGQAEGEAPLRGSLELKAAELGFARLGLQAHGLALALASSWTGEEILADGRGSIERVEAPGLWPGPLGDVQLDAAALLSGTKELRLTEFDLTLGSAGLRVSGQGQVVRPPEAEELSDLRLDLRTHLRLAAEQPVRLPGGLHVAGQAEAELAVKSVQPGVLRAEGKLVFGGLDLVSGGFTLLGAAGTVPVSQYVALRPEPGLLQQRPSAGG
ncbi:MAG TPA: hypothetical protein P5076_03250, partial [Myxococcota bacterium]|nr:hypothetical protein [Myxococcota bacterium]